MNEKQRKPSFSAGFRVPKRVIVKFKNEVTLPVRNFLAAALAEDTISHVSALLSRSEFQPYFGPRHSDMIGKLVNRARKLDADYHPPSFENYRQLVVENEDQMRDVVRELQNWPTVDFAYPSPGPVIPPSVNLPVNPLSTNQSHLLPSPKGIDAEYAWTYAGGDGENQQLADVEWGWNVQHDDLADHNFIQLATEFEKYQTHGTSVLGLIAACDNGSLCIGITPNLASIVTVSQCRAEDDYVTGQAVLEASGELDFGGVLLLEAQTSMYGRYNIPLEAQPVVFDLVKLATTSGITVVAAAGNGYESLDSVSNGIFDRTTRDSGAIIVASAQAEIVSNKKGEDEYFWYRFWTSCFGSRVDCFAQGQKTVVTLRGYGPGDNGPKWTGNFGETSAASAIVAGAALSVQGIAFERYQHRLGALEIRELLSAPSNTQSSNPSSDHIGVMPNLRKIIDALPATWP